MPHECSKLDSVLLYFWGVIVSLFVGSVIPIVIFVAMFGLDFATGILESLLFRREKWSWWRTAQGLAKGIVYICVIVACLLLDALAVSKAGVDLHGLFTKSWCIFLIGWEMVSIARHAHGCGVPLPKWWTIVANKLQAVSPDCQKGGGE